MSRISTGIGLVSGLDIESIVTKLMEIERRPIAQLETRVEEITNKKTVLAELTAHLLQLKLSADQMSGDNNVFTARLANSSNPSVLTATADPGTALGNYSFTVKSLVQAHQLVSRGFASTNSTPGAGTITIEMGGGNVDRSTFTDSLNGGNGVAPGSIYIRDRSGGSATIDLAGVVTVADVLAAINGAAGIGVTASVEGDHIVLEDTTGATTYDLLVAEVAGGSTAADLGILGQVAADRLDGSDVNYVSGTTNLDALNDGRGVRHAAGLDDLRITRRDGVLLDVNISSAESIGDILDLINNHANNADGLLVASISGDGTRLVLTDSTGGAGDLAVDALNASDAALDLGLLGSGSADTLTGGRVIAGINTVLLASINGGAGVPAGSIEITDRSGGSSTVDLSSAETLADVIDLINAAAVSVTASVDSSGTGLLLTDTSGGAGTLSVAEVDSTTAATLGILGSASGATLKGANLQLQYVSERTLLADLNGGGGVYRGRFRITDRTGNAATVDLSQEDDDRIEDVISEINSRGIGVMASINSTGDGIILTDTSGGVGTLKVTDLDGGTTAADLNISGSASESDPTHIDGSFEYVIEIADTDTLSDIATKIEDSGAPVSASVISDGTATNPYRLGLVSSVSGSVGQMVIDTGDIDLGLMTTQQARDAVVLYGQSVGGARPLVLTSTSNVITGLTDGLTLSLVGTSDSPVSVSVTSNDEMVVGTVQSFADAWNEAIDLIQLATSFNPDTQQAGILLGDPAIQRIERMLQQMISYNAPGSAPGLNRLSRVGFNYLETGNISFDPSELREALALHRTDTEELFATEDTGLGAHFAEVLEKITDEYDGVIKRKNDLFDDQIELLTSRITDLAQRLAKVQSRLYNEFYTMETVLSRLQTQRQAIENMPNFFQNNSGNNNEN
jgi:flagellar hook-associated protein 2